MTEAIRIAIPAHVNEEGVWLEFTSPVTGYPTVVRLGCLLEEAGTLKSFPSLQHWIDAQVALYKLRNPE